MEANENENTTVQNLWDTAKVDIKEKYTAIQAFLKKEERSQIHNIILYLKELEKEQQIKPKNSRRLETIDIRVEINAIKTKKQTKNSSNRSMKQKLVL